MKFNYLTIILLLLISNSVFAQNENETKVSSYKSDIAAKKEILAKKQAEVDALSGEISGIQNKLDLISGWKTNVNGILGFTFASSNNWVKQANPNSKISNITAMFSGSALLNKEKYFWRNEGNMNLTWQKTILDNSIDNLPDSLNDYQSINDVLTLTSLFGYKLTDNIAVSALGQYTSSAINNFNNPGILDLGVGATWIPQQISNLSVTVHPLNYHIVFKDDNIDTQSALGTKVFVSYFSTISKRIKWKTDLSAFLAYGSSTPSLNEYTWNNQLSFSLWKGIGVGIGFSLRNAAFESNDNQSIYNLGLSYNL